MTFEQVPIPESDTSEDSTDVGDHHPIAGYMKKADSAIKSYEDGVSRTFKETVDKYRRKYGRHPPPGFREWYKFAREKAVHNIDDFEQIMDDMRPFWGIKPSLIRAQAAGLGIHEDNGVSALYIRNHRIWKTTWANWRMDTFVKMVEPFVKHLPDMDIAMNREDQPRIVVPWDNMQALLKIEAESRHIALGSSASWTSNMTGYYKDGDTYNVEDLNMTHIHGKQFMLTAKEACPPGSPARNNGTHMSDEALYKDSNGGFITNFNTSTDLCIMGDSIKDVHGFMFASSTLQNSPLLLPIFGECKTNVNSDILFPANMYYKRDPRYEYDATTDYEWDDKHDKLFWRGATSGGTNTLEYWKGMHRNRMVNLANSTSMANKTVSIMKQDPERPGHYGNMEKYNVTTFLEHHADIGFTGTDSCVPDCKFYDDIWTFKEEVPMAEQFKYKYLIDVDGASFSGRWRAFLQSKSLPIKATIFKEWHDSRLIAWRHFIPLDNRFDELYSLLTYFIGLGEATKASYSGEPYVQRHDFEGRRIANQGREWASKVLREDDMEVSTLLLSPVVPNTNDVLDLSFQTLDRVRSSY